MEQEIGTHTFEKWLEIAISHSSNPEALKRKLEEEEQQKPKSEYELVHEHVERYNQAMGHLNEEDGYDCPLCKNKGFIMKVEADETGCYEVASDCKCMKIRGNAKRLKKSGLAEWVDSKTFDTFVASEDWQRNMKDKAMKYAENPTGWLYVGGQSGAGKTHICTAVCLKLIESGKSVKYLLWSEIIHKLESTRFDDSKREDYIDNITKNDIIYIDDFMKCFSKEKHLGIAFEFVNRMIMMKKQLILSSEMFCKEIAIIDEALGGRIAEKAKGQFILIVRDPNRNHRFK